MRIAAYAGASVALATGVFLKAIHQRANFYAACVYLSQSSANLMILTNLCLLAAGFLLFWLQRLLYGPLRAIETEQLYERAWFAVTETCLAMTIFRGELGGWFLVMFISLLVGKVWGWIGEGRVEYLEQQPPANPRLFHTRLAASLVLSVLFDSFMLNYCVITVLDQARPDMMVMFGFEFAILTILSTSTTARYAIALVEIYITRQQVKNKMEERRAEIREARAEAIRQHAISGASAPPTDLPDENDIDEMEIDVPGWEEKGRWVFYLDLLTDFLKLSVYLTFFAILITFYGLPIHILRDVVVTIRSFGRRIMDFLRYRNATRDMDERYPNATAEEVAREEVCIICREEMVSAEPAADVPENVGQQPPAAGTQQRVPDRLRPKKLPCGHILHFACLRSWLERQQNCPTCRRPVVVPSGARGAAGVNNAPGNGGAGAQPFNQAGRQPGAQGQDQPRARVYQLGPFRVGFGAVRGDLLQNLHQQIHRGNAPLQPANNGNPPGVRQVGFGFGFGRRPPAPEAAAPGPSNMTNVHQQLEHIERQITEEINSLRIATERLHHVRHLQTELDRIRLQQAASLALQPTPTTAVPPQPTPSTSVPAPSSITTSTTICHQFVSNPAVSAMGSDDARLPEGLTLPQGWTLVPLHPTEPNADLTPSVPETLTTQPAPDNATAPQPVTGPETAAAPQSSNEPEASTVETVASTATTAPVADVLPNWQSTPNVPSTDHRAESPSQEWTDIPSEQPQAGPSSAAPPSWGAGSGSDSESPYKGKGRAATVEEAADDGA
ncbi:hypothetical protein N7474_003807 [Penicillium riverlandense]|uniref:uncharacterized protein n=1 Tax=Penicillium riverlandense TaxID=1903569 RepID=UPI0025481A46|nr:uncharacterized protein N7474_003807 [Penicillium riverlandense]KAJ5818216.1 hypothetical protein N7474_003807 [Penicillium riverlandense]